MRAPTSRSLVAALLLVPGLVAARITAPSVGQRDAFCAGPRSSEACIDQSGNVLATTDNTSTSGTAALRWAHVYSVDFIGSGALLTGIPSTGSIAGVYLPLAGGTMSGQLNLANVAVNLTGASGNIISQSSVTASAFFGNGANVLGVVNITGNAATVTTNANLTGPVTSVGNATSIPGPVPQSAVNLSTVTTALAAKAASGTNADIIALSALTTVSSAYTETSSMTNTSANGLLVTSSVTAGSFFGDASHVTGVPTLPGTNTFTGLNNFSGTGSNAVNLASATTNSFNWLGSWYAYNPIGLTGSGGMSFSTGASSNLSYMLTGKTMDLVFEVPALTVVNGGSTDISFTIPAGKTAAALQHGNCPFIYDNNLRYTGYITTTAGSATMTIDFLLSGNTAAGTWHTTAGGDQAFCNIRFSIQ